MRILKNKKLIIGLAIALIVLGASIGGAVMAQGTSTTTPTTSTASNSGKTLMARVAAKLGIDESKLQTAFKDAQKEIQAEELDRRLSELVAAGKITQKQADDYKAWFNSRPDDSAYRKSLQDWQNAQPEMPRGTGLPGSGGTCGPRGGFFPGGRH